MEGYHQLMNIVVIGVGYEGLISGLGFAKLNHNVQFLDIDSKKIDKLKNNIPPFFEPELNQFLNNQELKNIINFHDTYDSISWNETDIVMVCVQTPALDDKEIDVSFLSNVFQDIQKRLKQDTIICIKSTIHPTALEKVLDSSAITEDQIVFNPEFLTERSARAGFALYQKLDPRSSTLHPPDQLDRLDKSNPRESHFDRQQHPQIRPAVRSP